MRGGGGGGGVWAPGGGKQMGIASPPRCGFAGPLLAPTKSPHIQLLPPAPPQIFFSLLSPLLSAAALAERERATRTEAEQPGWRAARGGGGGRSFRSVYRSGSRRRCGAPCEPRRGARRTWAGGPCGGGGGGVGCFVGMERAVLPAADGDGGI